MLRLGSKKYAVIISFLTMVLSFNFLFTDEVTAQSTETIKIMIDNHQLKFAPGDQYPVIVNERTYVPIRVISENLGASVDWKQDSRQVIINTQGLTSASAITPDRNGGIQIVINGKLLIIPADYGEAYISQQNRAMIPLRAVGEALQCEVNWIEAIRTAEIKSKQVVPIEASDPEKPTGIDEGAIDEQLLKDLAQYKTNLKLLDGSVINSEVLLSKNAASFSAEQWTIFKNYREQLAKYSANIVLPSGEAINTADFSILGDSLLNADQLRKWIASETPRIKAKVESAGRQYNPTPDLEELYIKIGAEYGIRGDVAFCQSAKETGYWQYTGDVQVWQNNYCGLWATGSPLTGQESLNGADPNLVRFEAGCHGAIFGSPAAGVEAHIQHLYAYATRNPLPPGKVLVDPRYSLVNKGIAPNWQNLNARWAVPGITYGQSILQDYWLKAACTK